jgi:ribosomal-protein-alanine N-acetyltransferase
VDGAPRAPILVGGGGTLGPPEDGAVKIGYSLLPEFQRRGYAFEMMAAIVGWIAADARVRLITADTGRDNLPSRRLLDRLGFREAGQSREPGSLRYERHLDADRGT